MVEIQVTYLTIEAGTPLSLPAAFFSLLYSAFLRVLRVPNQAKGQELTTLLYPSFDQQVSPALVVWLDASRL
jgi:hypothetical protein